MHWAKVLGLAAFAGVAATGVVVIRDERRRRAYTPADVRDRLHARLADPPGADPGARHGAGPPVTSAP
jgi:hypothetical protein